MSYSDSGHSEYSDAYNTSNNTSRPGFSGRKRAALTDHETKTVKAIRDAFKATDSVYCCSGRVPLEVKGPTIFYVVTPATFVTEWTKGETPTSSSFLDLSNPEADYNAFHNACLPAHYGHGKELVYDETYRLAREICSEAFGLNFDPIKSSNRLLSSISRLIDIPITAELYKINSYGPGGMFKAHQDTLRGQNHLGTLVVPLPSRFEGGEFILRKSGEEMAFDWSTSGRQDHPHDLHWVFFYADIEHEVLPVKTGYRLTVSYHIFGDRTTSIREGHEGDDKGCDSEGQEYISLWSAGMPTGNLNLQYKLTPLFSALLSSYKDPKFLPSGGRLAFGLDHEYGVAGKSNVRFLDDYYKGKDAVLVLTLKAMGLSYQFKAVYQVENDDDECPRPDAFATARRGNLLLIWDTFTGISWTGYDSSIASRLTGEGAEADHSLVWANRPPKYRHASTCASYGNEPSVETLYVAAALIVEVPAFGTTRRNGCFP